MIWLWLGISLLGILLALLVFDMVRMIGWRETGQIWAMVLGALVVVLGACWLIAMGIAEIST